MTGTQRSNLGDWVLSGARLVGSGDLVDIAISQDQLESVTPHSSRPIGPGGVDAEGRWVMPGLWDSHVHLGQWAATRRRIDLIGTSSPQEVLSRVATALAASDDDRPLIGAGYRLAQWSELPTVSSLDAVCGDRPVVLIAADAHNAWLSSAALDLAGLSRRDEPVYELEWFDAVARSLTAFGMTPTNEDYFAVIADMHRLGIVGVVDLEFERGFENWPGRERQLPSLRVRSGVYPADLDDAIAAGLRTGDSLGGLVTMGPLKAIVDGSLGTRTAYCCEPYVGTSNYGALNYTDAELDDLMRRARDGGFEVTFHAIGDAALVTVLGAFERSGARGSIEHAQLARVSDLGRIARAGLTASVQPAHLLDDRAIADDCWADRTARCYQFRAMLDVGVRLALGSDAPVSPLDPWLAIDAAVRRCVPGDEPWHPEQSITRAEALAASVDRVRVTPGNPADLILLDHDPLIAVRPAVAGAWIAGENVFDAR